MNVKAKGSDEKVPNREDETTANIKHPFSCRCRDCHRRIVVKYPYPAELECPACGNISMYHSEELNTYRCLNTTCQAEAKTLEAIAVRKAKVSGIMNGLLAQINNG